MDGDREVRRDRPGRRRPDQERGIGDRAVREARSSGRERDVDRGIAPLLVLELRFGERRAVREAPAHRLEGLVDEVLLVEAAEGPRDLGLVGEGHRRVRTVPEPADAQALELLALDPDVLLGVGAAGAADLDRAHVLLLARRASCPPSARSAGRGSPSPGRRARRSPSWSGCARRRP